MPISTENLVRKDFLFWIKKWLCFLTKLVCIVVITQDHSSFRECSSNIAKESQIRTKINRLGLAQPFFPDYMSVSRFSQLGLNQHHFLQTTMQELINGWTIMLHISKQYLITILINYPWLNYWIWKQTMLVILSKPFRQDWALAMSTTTTCYGHISYWCLPTLLMTCKIKKPWHIVSY